MTIIQNSGGRFIAAQLQRTVKMVLLSSMLWQMMLTRIGPLHIRWKACSVM